MEDTTSLQFMYGTGEHRFEEQVGLAVTLMWKTAISEDLRLRDLHNRIETAIRLEQIYFVYNKFNRVVGFFTWALLARDVVERLVQEESPQLHESEWNEGEILAVMDFAAPFGHAKSIVREMPAIFRAFDFAISVRSRGPVRRMRVWKQRSEIRR